MLPRLFQNVTRIINPSSRFNVNSQGIRHFSNNINLPAINLSEGTAPNGQGSGPNGPGSGSGGSGSGPGGSGSGSGGSGSSSGGSGSGQGGSGSGQGGSGFGQNWKKIVGGTLGTITLPGLLHYGSQALQEHKNNTRTYRNDAQKDWKNAADSELNRLQDMNKPKDPGYFGGVYNRITSGNWYGNQKSPLSDQNKALLNNGEYYQTYLNTASYRDFKALDKKMQENRSKGDDFFHLLTIKNQLDLEKKNHDELEEKKKILSSQTIYPFD